MRFEIAASPRFYTAAGPGRRTGCGSCIEIRNQLEQAGPPLSFVCVSFVSRAGLLPKKKENDIPVLRIAAVSSAFN